VSDATSLLREAYRRPMVPDVRNGELMQRADIERYIPHRGRSLLLDAVLHIDLDAKVLVAEYDLAGSAAVMEGHFPGNPVWPGLVQVEAIGQAGLLIARMAEPDGLPGVVTDVLGARFLRPVRPPGRVRLAARVIAEKPFDLLVGQCLYEGAISSAAVLRGLESTSLEIPAEGER
jgi:3-hydroxyacyl-[acyl-carrier-protein] dehydratase